MSYGVPKRINGSFGGLSRRSLELCEGLFDGVRSGL